MKKITIFIALMITSLGFAQNLITNGDFANGTTDWTFGPPGVVLDGEAYYSTANAGGNPWDTELKQTGKTFIGGNTYTLTFRARAAANRNISVNIQNTGIWNDQFRNNAVALTTTMTDYSYTFVATSTNSNAQLNFHMANMGTNTTAAVYIDDVTLVSTTITTCNNGIKDGDETGVDCGGSCAPCPPPPATPPSVAAPTPPNRNPSDVISLYSGAYTNVASNFDAGWCGGSSVQEVTIASNPTMAFKSNNCQGIVLDSGIDASSFTKLHVDVYIEAGTDLTSSVFNLKFVQQPGGAALEINLNVASTPALVAGSWLQIDVPVNLTAFTGFKEFGITSNLNNKLWYDNLYAYKGTALGTNKFQTSSVKMYPNPVKNTLTIDANSSINKVSVYNILGQEVMKASPKSNSVTLQTNELQKGVYMVTTEIDGKVSTSKVIKE
ncbi:carbohydrate binding domain-containing protein [Flavobacterium soyangense]|uniref:Carbohydrate binding domain-containing protein n=1 Tax=Flavobacterium soyangense TaxID=2023265 RepID=A0A930U6Z0_9FLAO|nr:carbohydrate binding domain-containing protein [Flavobacterium soyangense]MBF2708043.1 carbohydrate binding domain-containing protein [Flavobacterium soyangense]